MYRIQILNKKRHIPTDLEILDYIYEKYYSTFLFYDKNKPSRVSRIHIPIDTNDIANHFGVEVNIIFGRLHYHLEKKFGYTKKQGLRDVRVIFFNASEISGSVYDQNSGKLVDGKDTETINFPYMASVLADLRFERRKLRAQTTLVIISLVIAGLSLAVSAAILWK